MTNKKKQMTPDAARGLRRDLKRGLTGCANGRGDLAALLHEIERVAKYASGNANSTLEAAKGEMAWLVCQHGPEWVAETGLPGVAWGELYSRVQHARNDIAHTGTEEALAGRWVTAMAAVLMEVLAKVANTKCRTIGNYMASNPTCAEDWQTLADVRRTMLVNDYSVLPRRNHGDKCPPDKWPIVRADDLAAYLQNGGKFSETLQVAVVEDRLETRCAPAVEETEPFGCALGKSGPTIVVTSTTEDRRDIVGIVTAFDLL